MLVSFTICDRWERIASTCESGARFSGAMAACPTFFGIPKDNLAPPTEKSPPRIFHIEAGIQGTVHTSGILHAR